MAWWTVSTTLHWDGMIIPYEPCETARLFPRMAAFRVPETTTQERLSYLLSTVGMFFDISYEPSLACASVLGCRCSLLELGETRTSNQFVSKRDIQVIVFFLFLDWWQSFKLLLPQ